MGESEKTQLTTYPSSCPWYEFGEGTRYAAPALDLKLVTWMGALFWIPVETRKFLIYERSKTSRERIEQISTHRMDQLVTLAYSSVLNSSSRKDEEGEKHRNDPFLWEV